MSLRAHRLCRPRRHSLQRRPRHPCLRCGGRSRSRRPLRHWPPHQFTPVKRDDFDADFFGAANTFRTAPARWRSPATGPAERAAMSAESAICADSYEAKDHTPSD